MKLTSPVPETAPPAQVASRAAPSPSLGLAIRRVAPAWVDAKEYDFTYRTFEHPDGHLHYVDEGQGSPLLFVHGTPSWSFEWRAAINHCRVGYRCIAPDHLGFGLSDKPRDGAYLPRDHTRRLHDFIRTLDLRDITLVVHDFGGPIALPLLVRDRTRFRRVVASNTWAWPMDSEAKGRSIMRFVRSPLGRFLYLFCNASPRWLLPASFANRARLTRQSHDHYLAPFPERDSRRAPWTLGANLVDSAAYAPELTDICSELQTIPASLIWGKRDPVIAPEVLSQWRNFLPNSQVFELEDSGHFPQEETPEAFLHVLDAALSV